MLQLIREDYMSMTSYPSTQMITLQQRRVVKLSLDLIRRHTIRTRILCIEDQML